MTNYHVISTPRLSHFFFLFALVVFSFVDVEEELHYGEGTRDKSIKSSYKHLGVAFI